jgi:autotransporter-associated beta strand protein
LFVVDEIPRLSWADAKLEKSMDTMNSVRTSFARKLFGKRRARHTRRMPKRNISIEQFEQRHLLATVTWDGGGANNNWTTAANWVGDVAPSAGDDLVFTGNVRTTNVNNFSAGTTFNSITFDSGASNFSISGNQITLNGGVDLVSATGSHAISTPLSLGSASTVDITSGSLVLSGVISGSGSIAKTGAGTTTLFGANTFSGGVVIKAGTVASATSASALGTGAITIGDSSGSEDATLHHGYSSTHSNSISVAAGNTGLARITASSSLYTRERCICGVGRLRRNSGVG